MNDTQRNYDILLDAIKANNISAEELLDAFTNWHGLQLIDDDFMEFLEDEGNHIKRVDKNNTLCYDGIKIKENK